MEELISTLVMHARGIWRHRWWGLLAAWVAGVALVFAVLSLPDQYEAKARIYVDTQSVLKPLMQGLAVPSNVEQQVTILSRTLISRPNVEKLIRMADLDLAVKTREQREALVDSLMKRLQISSAGRDDLYALSYKDTDPARAKRAVQALVSIFVESGLGDKRRDSDEALNFIEEQIRVYENKLAEAENKLKEFKLKNMALFGESGKDSVGQLGELMNKLNQARLELREAENSRDAVKRQIAGEDAVFLPDTSTVAGGVSIPEIDSRIDAMKKQLDSLLQKYTEQHPDVVGTKHVIEQLEAQKRTEIAARRKSGSTGMSGNLGANPVYQQLKLSLSEQETTIAVLKTRVAEYESRLAAIKGSARMMPEVEAEYAQLNRDYEVNKRNYESLVSRREVAKISGEIDSRSGVAEFRLVDPPSVPSKPASPNRTVLMPAAGMVALALGALIAFLLSQIHPTFFDARLLREKTGLPVLGIVSMVVNPVRARQRRREIVLFAGGVMSFVAMYGAVTTLLVVRGSLL